MTTAQINTEIKNTKEVLNSLKDSMKDSSLPVAERSFYYQEYLKTSAYYLQLSQMKPSHNLTIA
jgi:hypothetical protein